VLQASYFDGHTTRLRVVNLGTSGEALTVTGEGIDLQVPFSQVSVDERLGRAPRRLRFQDGAFCEVRDIDALEVLLQSVGHRDGSVDRLQRQLRWVVVSTILSVALSMAAYKWGLPWAAAEGAPYAAGGRQDISGTNTQGVGWHVSVAQQGTGRAPGGAERRVRATARAGGWGARVGPVISRVTPVRIQRLYVT
jgi:hypothetical protein